LVTKDGCSEGLLETGGTVDGVDDRSGVGPWLTDGEIEGAPVGVDVGVADMRSLKREEYING